ncbi:MAG: DUF1549 and DUF1553 domain-containing protein, partial [Rubripirellula sp.]
KAVRADGSKRETFDLQQRFKEHWSWRTPVAVQPPSVRDRQWPTNEIDRFLLAKIEAAGLRPAQAASKQTWIRRVYFDLIGLPPAPEQILAFLEDETDHAYQQVVQQLLDSPQFGEKWARHWMDLVRYAETYGHEFDYPIDHAHEYRDYLIRAFNQDVPFDQFIREHVAGDLLEPPRRNPDNQVNQSIIATGFWYLHEATHAPTDVLGNEADIMDNQIDVFGKAFLGLTIACARCHDHKFDAISTADYYALSAYLQSSCRQEVPLDPGQQIENKTHRIHKLLAQAGRQLKELNLDAAIPKQAALSQWAQEPNPFTLKLWDDATDSSSLFEDFSADQLSEGWSTTGPAFQTTGNRIRVTAGGKLGWPGTVDSGIAGPKQTGILRSPTFKITTNQIHIRVKASANARIRLIVDNYQMAHFNALLFKGTFRNQNDTNTEGKWAWLSLGDDIRKYIGHKAYLEFVDEGDATIAIDEIRFANEARFSTSSPVQQDPAAIEDALRKGLSELQAGRSDTLIAQLLASDRWKLEELSQQASQTVARAAKIADSIPKPRFAIAMAQGTVEDAHVYIRGSHDNLGESVPPRFLQALDDSNASRLELANKIANKNNPLTARVIVNRIWHHVFGRGIVATVDDFGPQGIPPTHPQLLDWLARDFVADGWSFKTTIKKIVLSSSYRQSSVSHPDVEPELIATADPTNALLHRMRIRRLPSESIRDAILSVSGRLDPKQFGPGVATHRTPFMTGRGSRPSGPLDGNGRRSIYLSVYRNFLNSFMMTFDMPSPFGPKGRRSASNVPAQALTLLNDPLVLQQAEVWAKKALSKEGTDEQRITRMVLEAHGTKATDAQIKSLQQFLDQQAELHGGRDERAWTDLAHALLNMKAFYFLK